MTNMITELENSDYKLTFSKGRDNGFHMPESDGTAASISWSPTASTAWNLGDENPLRNWQGTHPLVGLAHELGHAYSDMKGWMSVWNTLPDPDKGYPTHRIAEIFAVRTENQVRRDLFYLDYEGSHLYPRPGYVPKDAGDVKGTPFQAWQAYDPYSVKW